MRTTAFAFLRATFYRWMQILPKVDEHFASTPKILAVGDLHVDNFGTWIDAEGRLIWGINDFDEAAPLPYTADLIRTACSINLAIRSGELKIDLPEACEALEEGYGKNLEGKGGPYVLGERHVWLRKAATSELRDPVMFWRKMDAMPEAPHARVLSAITAVEHCLPSAKLEYELKSRRAGLGSLGRIRYVALAEWGGGRIAREVKAMAPSGVEWAEGKSGALEILTPTILKQAVRCKDPIVSYHGPWQVRRLAPYCSRVELTMLAEERNEAKLIEAMGWETANIHRGSPEALKAILKHIKGQPKKWLRKSADAMGSEVEEDFQRYKKG